MESLLRIVLPILLNLGIYSTPPPPPPPRPIEALGAVAGYRMPTMTRLTVPYTVQAPFANWNIHEESCEEAALLMADQYATSLPEQSPAWYDKRLRDMKQQQKNVWGSEKDLTIAEMDALWDLAFSRPGPSLREVTNTVDALKWHLAHQRVIIIPVMSHQLRNPHYGPKSVYHMITLIGFEGDTFIANDPGIKQGRAWVYPASVVMDAWAAGVRARPQASEALVIGMPGDLIHPYLSSSLSEISQ